MGVNNSLYVNSLDKMRSRHKIQLSPEEETLLITLYTKAAGCPDSILADEKAQEIFARVDYEFAQLRVPTGTQLTVCLRARKFDDYVKAFLNDHPRGTVLHLGCGLDTRYYRIDNGLVRWFDLDFPSVIELRKRFFVETNRYQMIPSAVTELDWIGTIPAPEDGTLIIAEGLMMYLDEEQITALVRELRARFPGSILAFDAFSTLTARNIHRNPSIKATGAQIRWGIDDPEEIEKWAEGVQLLEEWYFVQSEHVSEFSLFNRLIFKIAGLFPAANKAHRILKYAL